MQGSGAAPLTGCRGSAPARNPRAPEPNQVHVPPPQKPLTPRQTQVGRAHQSGAFPETGRPVSGSVRPHHKRRTCLQSSQRQVLLIQSHHISIHQPIADDLLSAPQSIPERVHRPTGNPIPNRNHKIRRIHNLPIPNQRRTAPKPLIIRQKLRQRNPLPKRIRPRTGINPTRTAGNNPIHTRRQQNIKIIPNQTSRPNDCNLHIHPSQHHISIYLMPFTILYIILNLK